MFFRLGRKNFFRLPDRSRIGIGPQEVTPIPLSSFLAPRSSLLDPRSSFLANRQPLPRNKKSPLRKSDYAAPTKVNFVPAMFNRNCPGISFSINMMALRPVQWQGMT